MLSHWQACFHTGRHAVTLAGMLSHWQACCHTGRHAGTLAGMLSHWQACLSLLGVGLHASSLYPKLQITSPASAPVCVWSGIEPALDTTYDRSPKKLLRPNTSILKSPPTPPTHRLAAPVGSGTRLNSTLPGVDTAKHLRQCGRSWLN